jgi:hypothetical protein
MQGVECVNRLLLGEPEATIGIKYESTLDGRNAATHERSHLAGSGDPKRAAGVAGVVASATTSPKSTNPDATTSSVRPGESTKSSKLVGAGAGTTTSGHKDVGDKDEVHTSEEELGVTTPKTTKGATAKE